MNIPVYEEKKVVSNIEISKNVFQIVIEGKFHGNAGQFYMLRAWDNEPLLSRPISIHEINDNNIVFIYQVVGYGTKILASLREGDTIKTTGPLGNGFPLNKINGKIAVVTGGMGIAPMNFVCRNLENCNIDVYCGFKSDIYLTDKILENAENVYIATESGAFGTKGYVTDVLDVQKYDMVLCCGPEPMMNKVIKICKNYDIPLYVSMEKRMACGVGACLVCTCKTKSGNKRTCTDGPVFLGSDVIIND